MRGRLLAAAATAMLCLPASAGAHSTIQVFGEEIVYASEDAISDNRLTVREDATEVIFDDPEADGGIQSSDARCRGTRTEGTLVVEVRCRKTGLTRLSIDAGPNEDTATVVLGAQWQVVGVAGGTGRDSITVTGPSSDVLSGDQGADTVSGGDGDDDIRGEDGGDVLSGQGGNDRIQAGLGADRVDGGEGDDELLSSDGSTDEVACGSGEDRAQGDTVDNLGADCESVERAFVAPPPDEGGAGDDRTRPTVRVGGSTVQRVSRRRPLIRLAVTSSERGAVSASGFLDAGGLNLPLKSRDYAIRVAGGGVVIRIRMSKRVMRRVLRDLRRGRRPVARLHVAATDAAGNTAVSRRFTLRLRR